MIKFSQKTVKKSDVLELIDDELLYIKVRLTFQKKLNEQVLSYLKSFMSNNYNTNDYEKINIMSDYLNNASRILKRSSANLSKFETLQEKLTSMQEYFSELEKPSSNVIKTQFEDYNKKCAETIEKAEPATSEIQAFLAQCEQDDILKELLLERELTKKANEFVNEISNIQIQPISNIIEEQSQKETTPEIVNSELEIVSKEKEDISNETISTENIQTIENTENIKQESNDSKNDVAIIEENSVDNKNDTAIIEEVSNDAENNNDNNNSTSEEMSLFELNKSNDQVNINNIIIENTSNNDSEEKSTESLEKKNNIIENTLIISEKNGNVILPYTIEELNSALKKNPSKYKTLEDVIQKKYTKPMKYYKNSSIARFKETFKLVRERNKGPLKHAWDLALESFFNHDLHPAIISACKSIDELDIYLSCLEYDELEDFKFFKIIFDVLPTLNRKKKVST